MLISFLAAAVMACTQPDQGIIQLRFLADSDPGGAVIRWYTWSPVNHVEFVLPEGYLGSRVTGGVQIRPFDYTRPKKEYFANIVVTKEEEANIIGWAKSQIGKKYDWEAILGLVIKKDLDSPNKYMCSEFISQSFVEGGHTLFNEAITFNRVTPRDIAILKEVNFVERPIK